MTDQTGRIGYVGLGDMGGGIATHLAREGTDLTVFDINPAAIATLVAEGAKAADSLKALAEVTDVIVVCVVNNQQVKDVVAGLLEGSRPGQIIVIQATVLPQTMFEVSQTAGEYSVAVVDAPVSGHIEDRLNGTLTVIAGGADDVIERVWPVLSIIGSPVIHVGPVGAGQVAKLANNSIMHTTRNVAIEIMEMAGAYGVSEDKIREVCRVSSGQSWVLDNWEYCDRQTRGGFGANAPQVVESVEAAAERGIDLRLSRSVAALALDTHAARLKVLGAS